MPDGTYSVLLVLDELQKRIKKAGSLRKCAEQFGISAAYLSDVMRENREPGPTILDKLGMKKRVVREVSYDWK